LSETERPGEPVPAALPILAGVPPELYSMIRRREYRSNDAILTSGEQPDKLVILAQGSVGIHEGGTRVATRRPIRLLGELAYIAHEPRSASAIADDAVVTWEIDGDDVLPLMANSTFCKNLVEELAWKLREATSERSIRYLSEERLFGAFRSHASRELLDELLATGRAGEPRQAEVVAMFADIRGFTPTVEQMQPDDLMSDLGAFLELAIEVVQGHGGMIDKFIGDEVMALWGYAPRSDDPERALSAAVALVRRARALTLNGEPLRIGVGLELGTVTLGVVGGEGKSSFTAVGHAVNLAARLQGLTKDLKQPICVGPALAERLPKEIKAGMDGPVSTSIKGLDDLVQVWTHNPME
jgi:class 3 adenylate cyclase